MLKNENSQTKELEENSRDYPESNKAQFHRDKKPSILVETSLTTKDLTLVNSNNELKMATPSPSFQKNVPVGRKRRTKTPEPGFKTPNKNYLRMLSPRCSNAEDNIFDTDVPNIDSLNEAHYDEYKNRLFDKMLDCSRIIDKLFYHEDESGKVKVLPDDLILQSLNSKNCYVGDNTMTNICKFIVGVKLFKIKKDYGIEDIKEAAFEKLPHAMFTYAMITFRQFVKCYYSNKDSNSKKSKPPTKTELKKAVCYMLNVKESFFPLPHFLLGIVQLYNIPILAELIKKESISDLWTEYLNDVLMTGISAEGSEISDVWINYLNKVGRCKFDFFSHVNQPLPLKHTHILQDENGEYHKWMCNAIKYELAKSFMLERKSLSLTKQMLENLCSEDFVDAGYFYASSLLTNAFGDIKLFHCKNINKALDLLNRAVSRGHHEAMLLFGTIPFRKEFDDIGEDGRNQIGQKCFQCLAKYVMCGKDFRKEAAVLVAAEYLKKDGCYVAYDEENAKEILAANDCSNELLKLERYQQARKDANNAIHDVFQALEEVNGKLKTSGGIYAAQLLSILHSLFDALQGQGLNIPKSKKISLKLQLVHLECADMDTSTIERLFFSSMNLVFDILLNELEEPCCSIQQKILSSYRTYFAIEMELFSKICMR